MVNRTLGTARNENTSEIKEAPKGQSKLQVRRRKRKKEEGDTAGIGEGRG